jgi:Neurotransmitter-gated ion-channel ligand binding domain
VLVFTKCIFGPVFFLFSPPGLCRFCAVELAQICPFCFYLLYLVHFSLSLCLNNLSIGVCVRLERLLCFNGPSVFPFKDFTLDFYFRQFWKDPRLSFRKRPGVEQLSVGSDFIKSIWVPDTFFVNEKQSYFHIATTSNEFIRIHHTGSITRSIR